MLSAMAVCPFCKNQIKAGEPTTRVFDPSIPPGGPTQTVTAHTKCVPAGTPLPRVP
jgi:hypothetical protein